MPLQIGPWQLDSVHGGSFRSDGGAMFGVVPRVLWTRYVEPDQRNRIPSRCHCLLARDGTHTVLIDTGYGPKCPERLRELFALEPGNPLLESLQKLGVSPEQITHVVLTHLHFDHAGGGTLRDAQGQLQLAFPQARYVVQREEWLVATSGAAEVAGAYPQENLLPLQQHGVLELLDGPAEYLPGLWLFPTGGHTQGHQVVLFRHGEAGALYPADICPSSLHLPTMWCMAFDTEVVQTRRAKRHWLRLAARCGWWVIWDHDPQQAAALLAADGKREFVVRESRPVV